MVYCVGTYRDVGICVSHSVEKGIGATWEENWLDIGLNKTEP